MVLDTGFLMKNIHYEICYNLSLVLLACFLNEPRPGQVKYKIEYKTVKYYLDKDMF